MLFLSVFSSLCDDLNMKIPNVLLWQILTRKISKTLYVIAKSISACMYKMILYLWSLRIYFHFSISLAVCIWKSEVNYHHHNLISFQTYFSQMLLFL